jgi:hypothetical protein
MIPFRFNQRGDMSDLERAIGNPIEADLHSGIFRPLHSVNCVTRFTRSATEAPGNSPAFRDFLSR